MPQQPPPNREEHPNEEGSEIPAEADRFETGEERVRENTCLDDEAAGEAGDVEDPQPERPFEVTEEKSDIGTAILLFLQEKEEMQRGA